MRCEVLPNVLRTCHLQQEQIPAVLQALPVAVEVSADMVGQNAVPVAWAVTAQVAARVEPALVAVPVAIVQVSVHTTFVVVEPEPVAEARLQDVVRQETVTHLPVAVV